ncbi:MAG: phosphate ABC transporter permease PstA [Deltaproteobacteria bacterium]|jgi:phosphate transport system permease protein|nr:phosphate ABC transporter permease PstA [Deltaproteobacteria bacterium]
MSGAVVHRARSAALWRLRSAAAPWLCACCAAGVAGALLLILGYVVREGLGAFSLSFLTELPHPVGVAGGGVGNGIVGSLIIVGLAALMAFPVGTLAGIFLASSGWETLVDLVRYLCDVLASIPSIAIGLFAYSLLVEPFGHFSGFSASFAFAVLMLPLIIRTSEAAMRGVSHEIREAAIALGAREHVATLRFVLPAAWPGVVTGLLLAVARVTGETAPLLFTAFGSQFWELNPANPMAELSLQIFTYAISPYRSWHAQAWAGALLLILSVFALSVLARLFLRRSARS